MNYLKYFSPAHPKAQCTRKEEEGVGGLQNETQHNKFVDHNCMFDVQLRQSKED
jgi:hypothetical protein